MPQRRTKGRTYDSRKPLVCQSGSLDRQVGVLIEGKYHHLRRKEDMADCSYETVIVGTATYGRPEPLDRLAAVNVEMTEKVVADLETVIKELTEHKRRLCKELARMRVG